MENKKLYENCILCPRNCNTNRNDGNIGACMVSGKLKLARAALHYWEEPCISGENGSGTIFFSGCSLGCVFCQNYAISDGKSPYGVEVDTRRLAEIFYELKEKGTNNINFVTPTHFMPHIKESVKMAKEQGFDLPFIYNTSGYEKRDVIRELDGIMDVYLPDFKYYNSELSMKYSKTTDYFARASESLEEMVRQTGEAQFTQSGMIKKGVIVRHMVLPNHTRDSKKVIEYLYKTYGDSIYISIMNQYTPVETDRMKAYPELARSITAREYDKVVDYALNIGVKNAFIQEGATDKESFIPSFDGEGCR